MLLGCVSQMGLHAHCSPVNLCGRAPQHYCLQNIAWWKGFQDPQLNDLIATALCNSPNIQEAQARLMQAAESAQIANSSLWPSLDFNAVASRTHYSLNGLFPPPIGGSTLDEGTPDFNLDYDFDLWGKNRKNLAAAVSQAQAAAADDAMVRLTLSTSIANAYFQLQGTLQQIEVAQTILQERQRIQQLLILRAKRGLSSYDQVRQTQSDVAGVQLNLAQLQQRAEVLRDQIAALVGKDPEFGATIETTTRPNNFSVPNNIPAHLIAGRPDVQALLWQIDAANYRVAAAKTEFYPDLNLSAYAGLDGIPFGNVFKIASRAGQVAPAISLPIFHGGEIRANLGVRYAQYDVAVARYNQLVLTSMQQVADQIAIMRALQTQENAQQDSLTATDHIYQLTNDRFKHGLQNGLDEAQAHLAVLSQQQTQIQIQTQYMQATVNMIKALGGNYPQA